MEKIAGICSGMAVEIRSPDPPECHRARVPASEKNFRTGARSLRGNAPFGEDSHRDTGF